MAKLWGNLVQWIVDLALLNTYRGYTLDEGLGQPETIPLNVLSDGEEPSDIAQHSNTSDVPPSLIDSTVQSHYYNDTISSNDINDITQPSSLSEGIQHNDLSGNIPASKPSNTVQCSKLSKAVHSIPLNDTVHFSDSTQTIRLSKLIANVQSKTFNAPIDLYNPNTIRDSTSIHVSDVRIPSIPINTRNPNKLSIFGVSIPSFPRTSSSEKTLELLEVPELSRTTTRESSLGTSSRSPDRTYAYTCPSCGNTGICGCSLRAGSLHGNRKKEFGFCTDTEFEQTYYPIPGSDNSKIAVQDSKNNAWLGYRSALNTSSQIPTLLPTGSQSMEDIDPVKHHQPKLPIDEDGMVGLGCYRFAKDASKEEIIDNTIAKLGELAPLASQLAMDGVKVYGYDNITYDDILRKKYEREFPDRSTPYKEHITPDGILVCTGFPKTVKRDDREHLRFHTWIEHTPHLQEWQLAHYRHSGRCASRDREFLPVERQQERPARRRQHVRFADEAAATLRQPTITEA